MYEILMTGASGFLGKKLIKKLESSGNRVTAISREEVDLSSFEAYRDVPKKKYNKILHLATWTRAGTFCQEYPGDQWLVNEQINLNILRFWRDYASEADFVAFGTSAAYNSEASPLRENDYLLGEPSRDYYGYSTTKVSLLHGLKSLNLQYGLKFQYFIPSMIYGPDYHTDGRTLHFIFDIMLKIYRHKILGCDIYLWGDGSQKREILYIEDAVDIISAFINSEEVGVFNLNSGQSFTIKEIAFNVCSILNVNKNKIMFDISKGIGAKSKLLSNEKINKKFKFNFTPLNVGLENTLNWVIKNYENL